MSTSVPLHLRQVVREIRGRILPDESHAASGEVFPALAPLRDAISKLGYSNQQLCSIRHNVGRMPPGPNTARARLGAVLVRIVRQMLFWYTPQIHTFHDATSEMSQNLCAVVEKQYAALQRLHVEVAELRSELRVRRGMAADAPLRPAASDPAFDHLLFSLQNRHPQADGERQAELRDYAEAIEARMPPVPDGPWLDLRCGRGDWLEVNAARGRDILGLDQNTAAVEHCRARGLKAVARDPVTYLHTVADSTYSVVSALEVIERHPPAYVARLLREAVRVLKPEGFLLFEAENPASLVGASEELWADPAVLRPWPAPTAEFFLEYFGLQIVSRRVLGPYPAEERLPFTELDFIQQLNARLYGPRRYALLGRRPAAASAGVS